MDDSPLLTSRLLALPRELRDHIYSYLYVEIDFSWDWRKPPRYNFHRRGDHHHHQAVWPTVRVHLHHVPLPSVLLVGPSIRAEFFEVIFTHGLCATIRLDAYQSAFDTLSTDHTLCVKTLPAILKDHLRHVTLLIDCGSGEPPDRFFWARVNRLADALHSQASHVSVLRIALQYRARGRLHHRTEQYRYWTRPRFLHTPHLALAQMPLVQRCEGYRLEQYRGTGAMSSSKPHAVVIHGCYLYTRGTAYDSYLWSPDEVTGGLFEVNAYTDMVEGLPRDALQHEMREWREVRGHDDLVKWNDADEKARLDRI